VLDTGNEPRAPSDTGTDARWAASLWNTPLAAQWADSRIAWREGSWAESREAIALPGVRTISLEQGEVWCYHSSMKGKNKGEFLSRRGWLWRLAPALIMIILYAGFIAQTTIYNRPDFSYMLITPERHIIIIGFIAVATVATIAFPYQFWIHAAFCMIWGLVRIADGELTTPLVLYLFGSIFLFRMGFFKSHEVLKVASGVMLLVAAIISQYRLHSGIFVPRMIYFSLILILLFLVVIVLQPEIKIIRIRRRKRILRLSPERFTEKDAEILRKIRAGEKYEAIAQGEEMSVSTVKRHISKMFDTLHISDHASFMSRYADHTIVRGKEEDL